MDSTVDHHPGTLGQVMRNVGETKIRISPTVGSEYYGLWFDEGGTTFFGLLRSQVK